MANNDYSKLIAGTMTWGKWGSGLSGKGMMHCCIDNDITTFDHADIYGEYS